MFVLKCTSKIFHLHYSVIYSIARPRMFLIPIINPQTARSTNYRQTMQIIFLLEALRFSYITPTSNFRRRFNFDRLSCNRSKRSTCCWVLVPIVSKIAICESNSDKSLAFIWYLVQRQQFEFLDLVFIKSIAVTYDQSMCELSSFDEI